MSCVSWFRGQQQPGMPLGPAPRGSLDHQPAGVRAERGFRTSLVPSVCAAALEPAPPGVWPLSRPEPGAGTVPTGERCCWLASHALYLHLCLGCWSLSPFLILFLIPGCLPLAPGLLDHLPAFHKQPSWQLPSPAASFLNLVIRKHLQPSAPLPTPPPPQGPWMVLFVPQLAVISNYFSGMVWAFWKLHINSCAGTTSLMTALILWNPGPPKRVCPCLNVSFSKQVNLLISNQNDYSSDVYLLINLVSF